jgi:hypothetical protein
MPQPIELDDIVAFGIEDEGRKTAVVRAIAETGHLAIAGTEAILYASDDDPAVLLQELSPNLSDLKCWYLLPMSKLKRIRQR